MKLSRRRFLQNLSAASAALAIGNIDASPSAKRHSRIIPSSAETIPVIGMGSWLVFAIDPDNDKQLTSRQAVIQEFLNRGGGMIDSSPMYGVAQDVIGRSLKRIDNHAGLFAAKLADSAVLRLFSHRDVVLVGFHGRVPRKHTPG